MIILAACMVTFGCFLIADSISTASKRIVNAILYPSETRSYEQAEGIWPYCDDWIKGPTVAYYARLHRERK